MDFHNYSFNADRTLNRSISAPDISAEDGPLFSPSRDRHDHVIRRTYIEHIIPRLDTCPLILRQYSCEEIYPSKSTSYKEVKPTFLNTECTSPSRMPQLTYNNQEEEPMDVDCSDVSLGENQCKPEKYSFTLVNETNQELDTVRLRSGRREIEDRKESQETKSELYPIRVKKKPSYRFLLGVLCVCLVPVYFLLSELIDNVNGQVNVRTIQTDLELQVHHQKDSIEIIVNSLRNVNYVWEKNLKVVVFVGRSGVGKTFVANIVKNHFHKKFVHELHGSLIQDHTKQANILDNLHQKLWNLLIIDDLKVNDTGDLLGFLKKIEEKPVLVFVIVIYNIQEVDNSLNYKVNYGDIIKIRNYFDESEVIREIVVFNEFDANHVRDWIRKQLLVHKIDNKHHNNIINEVLRQHDVGKLGFKGLHLKLMKELKNM